MINVTGMFLFLQNVTILIIIWFLDNSTSCHDAAMGKANFLRNVLFWSQAHSLSPPNGLAYLFEDVSCEWRYFVKHSRMNRTSRGENQHLDDLFNVHYGTIQFLNSEHL